MRSAGLTAIALLSLGTAGAIVVDGPSLKEGPSVAAIARIHTPSGLIASGTLLAGGRYVLTAAHVVADIPGGKISRGLVEFPSGTGRPRSRWKAVYTHPKALEHRAWDAALIELAKRAVRRDVLDVAVQATWLARGQYLTVPAWPEMGSLTHWGHA